MNYILYIYSSDKYIWRKLRANILAAVFFISNANLNYKKNNLPLSRYLLQPRVDTFPKRIPSWYHFQPDLEVLSFRTGFWGGTFCNQILSWYLIALSRRYALVWNVHVQLTWLSRHNCYYLFIYCVVHFSVIWIVNLYCTRIIRK